MMTVAASNAAEIFERQVQLAINHRREEQLALLAADVVWEYGFPGTPGALRMEGADEVRRQMMPRWEGARKAITAKIEYRPVSVVLDAADPDRVAAEFDLLIGDRTMRFVQFLLVRNGKIVELREYFDPRMLGGSAT